MTPRFCASCGQPLVAGASFCGSCGHHVAAAAAPVTLPAAPRPTPVAPPPTPVGSAAPAAPAPFAPVLSGPPRRRVGGIVLLAVLAVLVMLGAGTGTAYLLTRDDDSPSDRASDSNAAEDDGPADAPTPPADEGGDPTATVTVSEGTTTETTPSTDSTDSTDTSPADPETALRDVIAADAATTEGLVGYWVPQIASISGDINGSWAAALAEYERLKGFFPDLVVVDAADWPHAFVPSQTYDDVLVALSPTPASVTSAPVLDWCQLNRGDRQESCYAKLLETSGSPRDNADQNRPEPEFN